MNRIVIPGDEENRQDSYEETDEEELLRQKREDEEEEERYRAQFISRKNTSGNLSSDDERSLSVRDQSETLDISNSQLEYLFVDSESG
jgi:hypothetical protein